MNYNELMAAITILVGAGLAWRFYMWTLKRKRS
jgi:hypothetical protein